MIRELTSEEATLFYTDYSLFRALHKKALELESSGRLITQLPGGILCIAAQGMSGMGVKALAVLVTGECIAKGNMTAADQNAPRVELVNDSLCFVSRPLKEILGETSSPEVEVIRVVQRRPEPQEFGGEGLDANFDLDSWNPDSTKLQ